MVGSSVGIMFGAGGPVPLARSHKSPRTVSWASIVRALATARSVVIQSIQGGSSGGGFGFAVGRGFGGGFGGGFGLV